MNIFEDKMFIYRVAKNYYLDNMSQAEIAEATNISRPQISRLIKTAHELGIVKIDVTLPDTVGLYEISQRLQSLLKIKQVVIAPSPLEGANGNFFSFAANYIKGALVDSKKIGIGWGQALYKTSQNLTLQADSGSKLFVALVGNSGNTVPQLQTNNITDRFAEKFNAKAHFINAAVVSPCKDLTEDKRDELEQLQKIWASLDTAVIGIGGYHVTQNFYIRELSSDPLIDSQKNNILGDALSHFFLKGDQILELPKYYCHVACPLQILKKIPKIITICIGIDKIDAIYFAASQKIMTHLVTDEQTAKAILSKYC